MSKKRFFRKIPRAGIYLKLPDLLTIFFKILLKKPQKAKIFPQYFKTKETIIFPRARIALFYLLKNLNIPEQSEVILTPLTIADIINAVRWAGLRPVFCDLGKNTYNIDYQKLKQAITPKTKVILITHLTGLAADMDKIREITKEYNLILIEDASQAFGAKFKDKYLGTFGLAGIFSLSFLKTCSTLFGGMLITDNSELGEKLKKDADNLPLPPKKILLKETAKNILLGITTHRIIFSLFTYYLIKFLNPEIIKKILKSNPRPSLSDQPAEKLLYSYTNIQLEMGLKVLENIQQLDEKRIENAKYLMENLTPEAKSRLPVILENTENTFWRLPIQVENPEEFKKYLFKNYIDSAQTNLILGTKEPAFQEYSIPAPEAEKAHQAILIPIHPSLSKKDMLYMAEVINYYFKI